MEEAFLRVDEVVTSAEGNEQLKKYSTQEESGSQWDSSTGNIAHSVGCTAICALITPTEIYVANAGDSRCVMYRGHTVELSEDHKPDNLLEKKRIEEAGGFVSENRVKGILNLSR